MRFAENKNRVLWSVAGLATLAIAIFVVLFSGASSINRETIEKRLQSFGAQLEQQATSAGKEGKFSYGNLAIEGWGYNKKGVVDNVALEIAQKSVVDSSKWSLSTARMLVEPDPTAPERLFFVFGEPINIIENSQLKTIVTFAAPLRYGYFDGQSGGQHLIEHALYFPEQVVLTDIKGDSGATPEHTTITYDKGPMFVIRQMPDSKSHEGQYEFHNVKIEGDSGVQATIASLASSQSETMGKDNRLEGKYALAIADLALKDPAASESTPYTIGVDLAYKSDETTMDLRTLMPSFVNADISLNKLLLATPDFKVKAEGTLSTASDDPLPFGAVDVHIDNAPKLLASELLPSSMRLAAANALQKIAGHPVDTAEPFSFALKREKNGVSHVGNTTFEELTASVLGDMLKPPVPPADVAPAAPTPDGAVAPAAPDSVDEAPAPDNGAKQPDDKTPAKDSL